MNEDDSNINLSFNMVTHISTGISLIACLLVAVCGYVVFTNKTEVGRRPWIAEDQC